MNIKEKLVRSSAELGAQLAKHSPTIALGAGVVGLVGTVVLSSRATLKAKPKFDAHQTALMNIRQRKADDLSKSLKENKEPDLSSYTKESYGVWIRFISDCARAYALPFSLGVVSIGLIVAGHKIQANRIAGLTMAYEGLKMTFDKYREAVIEAEGEEADSKYLTVARDRANAEIQEALGDAEIFHTDSRFVFSTETSSDAKNSDMWNANFLTDVEAAMNRRLDIKGVVFLNEVLEALGMERTPAGQQLGWVKNDNPDYVGIDFGWRKLADEITKHRLKNAESDLESIILLDFNYDGIVWDRL